MNMANNEKKPYLVDVPVKVNIWIRPRCQRAQFEVIKQARPSILILQSDGGRNEKEWAAIRENRHIFEEEVDWECTIHRLYEVKNNGLYTMSSKVKQFIWSHYDRCIFLEDDHIPAVSFFQFCAELLEKYKDDTRISLICGSNQIEKNEECTSDYFFSRAACISGIATWKRVIDNRDSNFNYAHDPYIMKLLKQRCHRNVMMWDQIKGYACDPYFGGHLAASEFFLGFDFVAQNQLCIIPKNNMICSIGTGDDATHGIDKKVMGKSIAALYDMKTYEVLFPLKHPSYVIPDEYHAKKINRIFGNGYPLLVCCRKLVYWSKLIRYRKFGYIFSKSKAKLSGKKHIEE
jgi:hypothetical protein